MGRKKDNPIDLNNLKVLSKKSTPARTWVNLLLFHIWKEDLTMFTFQKSKGIPPIPLKDELPEGELSFEGIINRLKVMSGLDPVKYKSQKICSFPLGICGVQYTMKTVFDDNSDQSCSITLTTEGNSITNDSNRTA